MSTNIDEMEDMKPDEQSEAEETTLDNEGQVKEEEAPPPPEIDLKVSSDNLTVYVRVKLSTPTQTVSPEEIVNVLTTAGVSYGFDDEAIQRFCENRMFYTDLVAAKGLLPVDGQNGTIKYHFKVDDSINLKEQDDGTIDFKDLGLVQNVSKGDVLCTATPPIDGIDGINVFGEAIPFKHGTMPTLNAGANTVISDDQLHVLADIDGCVELKGQLIYVNDVFTVKGDVDTAVGNIESVGSVLVQGDLREGFIIKAEKDVTIKGMVEGANIIAGGIITIANGMNGMGRGTLKAGGNIVSKYIENATVESGGDVYADVLMNSHTSATGSVIMKGSRASIIGGTCQAGIMVYASCIGSSNNVPTVITLDSHELRKNMTPDVSNAQANIENLTSQLNAKNLKQAELQATIRILSMSLADPKAKLELKNAMVEKNKNAEQINVATKKLEEAKELMNKPSVYKVIALKQAYIGTRINIGYLFMNLEEDYSYTKFSAVGHTLAAGQILPSDKL